MEIQEIIRQTIPMTDEAIKLIVPHLEEVHVLRGKLIIEEGKRNNNLYFVKKGLLRNYVDCEGKEDTRYFALEGDVVTSLMNLYANQPAMSSVEAIVASDLLCCKHEVALSLIEQSHEWALWCSKLLIEQIYALERRYTYIGPYDAYTRYLNFMKMRNVEMIQMIPLKHVASYLKITPQTLSKIRRKFVKE